MQHNKKKHEWKIEKGNAAYTTWSWDGADVQRSGAMREQSWTTHVSGGI